MSKTMSKNLSKIWSKLLLFGIFHIKKWQNYGFNICLYWINLKKVSILSLEEQIK